MHAVLSHQICRVYLTGLTCQSNLIFLVDQCMAMVNCIYRLIFPRIILLTSSEFFLFCGWGFWASRLGFWVFGVRVFLKGF